MCERDFVHNFEDAWPETGVQPEGRIDDKAAISFLSFLEACASQHSRRAKNLRAFLGFEFGHAGFGGRTNQTKQGNEFHARTRRRKNWRGKIRFWETFAPWPLCVSL
jgi:hypothetical protein